MGSGSSKIEAAQRSGVKQRGVVSETVPPTASRNDDESGPSATASNNSVTPNNTNNNGGGGCPMKQGDGSYSYDWKALFRPNFPHGPGGAKPMSQDQAREAVKSSNKEPPDSSSSGGCPVKNPQQLHPEYNVYSQPIDPTNQMPSTANQQPAPNQQHPLSTDRVPSSIPKGGTKEETTWTYPSPHMFYNALVRKGKLGDDTDERDMASVVAIHNNMNEKTWRKIQEWEETLAATSTSESSSPPIKLLKFQGRPTDLSPKARFKHYVLGHPLPYDRHDWTVLREDGTTVRYVIDYYNDETRAQEHESSALPDLHNLHGTPSLLVDVRPALDGPTELWNRLVTMPWARHVGYSTKFEPLPLFPTSDLKSQVRESVQIWESIQQSANKAASNSKDTETSDLELPMNELTEKRAQWLAKSFSEAQTDCRYIRKRTEHLIHSDGSSSEAERAQARMDFNLCMAKFLCPDVHDSLVKSLQQQQGDHDDDEKLEQAMAGVSDCLLNTTMEHAAAVQKYPQYFEKGAEGG